ncbi:MAG: class I SAM-dependent methyltransferase [Caldiserica bacterium]|nr:class I SAM-dependent methyltransferase [Caldisericota bacterium]
MNFWERHFEERAKKLGELPEACDHKDRIAFLATRNALKSLLEEIRGKRILDVGCGNGIITEFLTASNEVLGLDFSFSMLKMAEKKNFIPILGGASHLPFKSNTFDCVLGIGLLQYIENEAEVVREMARVTKPRGTIILSLLHKNSLIRELIEWTGKETLELKKFSLPQTRGLLKTHGIGKISFKLLSYPLPCSFSRFPLPLVTTFLVKGEKIA